LAEDAKEIAWFWSKTIA